MDDSDVVEIQQMIELQPVCGVRPGRDTGSFTNQSIDGHRDNINT